MSRSGYSDDCENYGLWRGAVERAIRGKRGQAFLREMLASLDAMPDKRLIREEIVTEKGEACAIGAVALTRKLDVSGIDPEDRDQVANKFGIAMALAAEIEYENDEHAPRHERGPEGGWVRLPDETPEQRWTRMRAWVAEQIIPTPEELLATGGGR